MKFFFSSRLFIFNVILTVILIQRIPYADAATYIPPATGTPGSIKIENVGIINLLGSNGGGSAAILSSFDETPLYVGQVYQLDSTGSFSGVQDASYTSLDGKLVIPQMKQTDLISHSVTLLKISDTPLQFSVIALSSSSAGNASATKIIFYQGPKGDKGESGQQGLPGAKGDQGAVGAIGDTGPQGSAGPQGEPGTAGENGKTIWSGATPATSLIGVDGDFYIDTILNTISGPKTNGLWSTPVLLVGDKGVQGIAGPVGPQGPIGSVGPQGIAGPVGPQGPIGSVGPQGIAGPVGSQGPIGPTGADGLTTSVNNVTQVNGNITLTQADINLANVDNTSDINKPISTAAQNALNLKANLISPALSGIPTAPTAALGTNTTQIATTEFLQKAITHTVGESYGGGIIFYVYDGGKHGLIAATSDQSPSIAWDLGQNVITRARADGIGAGKANTLLIITTQLVRDDTFQDNAAMICNEYSAIDTIDSSTYGDWYLPSRIELDLLHAQKDLAGLNFLSAIYWSSTENKDVPDEVWAQDFANSAATPTSHPKISQISSPTPTLFAARAIRAF